MREIETALLANHKHLYHPGMEAVAKSTLSELEFARPRVTFQPIVALKFLPDSSEILQRDLKVVEK